MNRRAFLLASTGCAVAAKNSVIMIPPRYGLSEQIPAGLYKVAVYGRDGAPELIEIAPISWLFPPVQFTVSFPGKQAKL